ncbi:hypothetical protein AC578_4968 [Pseudocercospora eumusae]|uniref:Uncharacterized protein n=1 Tax=Pseudocercospora eumusae TaxID=321146 RepID=A0A139HNQ5_9PEZI|nr:hypothetical protein AC578_4968 [Pseudocercospora eumusae]
MVSDRFGAILVATLLNAVFISAVWIPGTSYGVLVFFALFIGATIGTLLGEVVALYLRRPSKGRWGYLYAQLFAGVSYLMVSIFMLELWRIKRKQAREEHRSDQMVEIAR